jgi:hypothetical protein
MSDLADTMRAIVDSSLQELRATNNDVPGLISGAWLHGLVVGLALARRDCQSATELLALIERSRLAIAARVAQDETFTNGLLRKGETNDRVN